MFFGKGIRLGKISGINISVDLSWFIIFGLFVFSLARGWFPFIAPHMNQGYYWLFGVITSLLFFGSVVAHELSHALVARRLGIPISNITLFIFGGVAQMEDEPATPGAEFKMAIAGPLASLGVAAVCLGIAMIFLFLHSRLFYASFSYLWIINVILAVFNLIPGFPMDGGRVFRAFLWWLMGDLRKSTLVASVVGQTFGWIFILGGVGSLFFRSYGNFIWFALVGWFLVSAARSSYQQVLLRETLRQVPISEVMSSQVEAVPADITVERLVSEYFLREGPTTLPVEQYGKLIGTISLEDIRAIPREQWRSTVVTQVMHPLENEPVLHQNNNAWDATNRMVQANSDRVLVEEDDQVKGMVTRSSIMRWLQMHSRLAPGQA